MTRCFLPILAAALAVLPLASAGAETMREHGAHVHGHGRLNLVLEGNRLNAELVVPAFDIIGFEHPPRDAAERKAVNDAVAVLADPGRILGPTPAAGCAVREVSIENTALGPEGAAEHGEGAAGEGDEEVHSEFHVDYRLICADASAFRGLSMGYFEAFSRAEELEVQAVGPWGQTGAELTAKSPAVEF